MFVRFCGFASSLECVCVFAFVVLFVGVSSSLFGCSLAFGCLSVRAGACFLFLRTCNCWCVCLFVCTFVRSVVVRSRECLFRLCDWSIVCLRVFVFCSCVFDWLLACLCMFQT